PRVFARRGLWNGPAGPAPDCDPHGPGRDRDRDAWDGTGARVRRVARAARTRGSRERVRTGLLVRVVPGEARLRSAPRITWRGVRRGRNGDRRRRRVLPGPPAGGRGVASGVG